MKTGKIIKELMAGEKGVVDTRKKLELKACLQTTGNFTEIRDYSNITDAVLLIEGYFTYNPELGRDVILIVNGMGRSSIWRGNWNDGVFETLDSK